MRRAVVIGNSAYDGNTPPHFCTLSDQGVADAESVAEALECCDFSVEQLSNASDSEIDGAIARLSQSTSGGDVAAVFFGGHAIGRAGEHFLLGTRADRNGEQPSAGLPLSGLLAGFASEATVLLFVDACRNTYVEGFDTTERGQMQDAFFTTLSAPASVEPPQARCLISWSTQPGQTVPDGEPGQHSPYVAALLNAMEEGLALPALLAAILEDVELRTQGAQTPCVDDVGSLLAKEGAGRKFLFFRGSSAVLEEEEVPVEVTEPVKQNKQVVAPSEQIPKTEARKMLAELREQRQAGTISEEEYKAHKRMLQQSSRNQK